MTELAARILTALAQQDGQPLARLRKQLDVAMSELLRNLSALEALHLTERREQARRDCVFLTDKGRALMQSGEQP